MIPGADLIIGLFLQLIIWAVLRFVRFVFGVARTALVGHPGLTAVVLITAVRRGWIDLSLLPWLAPWLPLIASMLFIFGAIRFFTEHPPTGIVHTVHRHHRRTERLGRQVTEDGRWIRERFRRNEAETVADLPPPPPPAAIPLGPVAEVR